MSLAREVRTVIQRHHLAKEKQRLLVAVSGGVDSMVLLHLLHQLRFPLEVAHVNFGLRGDESAKDEELVAGYCEQLGLKLHVAHPATKQYATEKKISIQMAARELRYSWFEKICSENQLDLIVTAHHADDQAETVLLKMLRGAGPAALAGIRLKQHNLIRPLLFVEKKELLAWANEHRIPYREDASNATSDYQRNQLRNEIIPLLKNINPGLTHTLSGLSTFMQSHDDFLKYTILNLNCLFKNPVTGFTHILTRNLVSIPGFDILLFEMLQPFAVHPADIENICRSLQLSGKQFFSPTHSITVGRNELIIAPIDTGNTPEISIPAFPFSINTPWGNLHGTETFLPDHFVENDRHVIYADLEQLQFPLVLRTWKEGDAFHPAGMKGRKKLSDFFTDHKLSLPEKKNIPLLFSGNDLVWVCNMRMDQRFTLTAFTRRILKITFMPGVNGENVIEPAIT